jgi:hypothetical protein
VHSAAVIGSTLTSRLCVVVHSGQDFECIEKLMVNEELYRETLLHIPGSPHIPYLGMRPQPHRPPLGIAIELG